MRRVGALLVLVACVLVGCSGYANDPTDVTSTSATLRGHVEAGSGDTSPSYFFRFRKKGTSAWTNTTRSYGSGTYPEAAVPISGLQPGTVYEGQLCGRGKDSDPDACVGKRANSTDPVGTVNGTFEFRTSYLSVPTRAAQAWRDSVELNIRTGHNGPYMNYPKMEAAFAELGIDRCRDGLYPLVNYPNVWAEYRRMSDLGIRCTFGVGDLNESDSSWNQKLTDVSNDPKVKALIDSYEAPNEPDGYTTGARCYGTTSWQACLREYVRRQAAKIAQTDPGSPYVGPSFQQAASASQVGDLSAYVDFANIHPYPGGGLPGPATQDLLDTVCKSIAASKPCVSSEVGYHADVSVPFPGGNDGVGPQVRASYTLKLLLENWRRGVPRTSLFTIVDNYNQLGNGTADEGDWGLYNSDWTPRQPTVSALSAFMKTLGKGGAAGSAPLQLSLPADAQSLAFTRSDGATVVAIWRNVNEWDRTAKVRIAVPNATATVQTAKSVSVVRPVDGAGETALGVTADGAGLTLGQEPVLLILR